MDELLNEFSFDCNNYSSFDHRIMYNRMVGVMDEMLAEIFDDLVAPENLSYNYWLISGNEQFTWPSAIHNLNLSGLQEATEFINDNTQNGGVLGETVNDYVALVNGPTFNKNTCN